jgi:hypothetical protein
MASNAALPADGVMFELNATVKPIDLIAAYRESIAHANIPGMAAGTAFRTREEVEVALIGFREAICEDRDVSTSLYRTLGYLLSRVNPYKPKR